MPLVVSCEHGGNDIPPAYEQLFREHGAVLGTHLGLDVGAADVARGISSRLGAPLCLSTTTRLLVDLNRSIGNRSLFSQITRSLPPEERRAIIDEHYIPYRRRVEAAVAEAVEHGGRVLHLSVHTFTPVLRGEVRLADIGLLSDPRRALERSIALAWQADLRSRLPALKVRLNYPYRGVSDGFTTHLRRLFPPDVYAGIELEVNHKHATGDAGAWKRLRETIARSLEAVLAGMEPAPASDRSSAGGAPASPS